MEKAKRTGQSSGLRPFGARPPATRAATGLSKVASSGSAYEAVIAGSP